MRKSAVCNIPLKGGTGECSNKSGYCEELRSSSQVLVLTSTSMTTYTTFINRETPAGCDRKHVLSRISFPLLQASPADSWIF